MSFQSNEPNIQNLQSYLADEREKKDRRDEGSSVRWWSIPSGMSSLRILPPWDPSGRIALPVYMHPIEYQDDKMKYKKYNWTCVSKTFGKPCSICNGLQSLTEAGLDVSRYEANRRQFYMNAIVMYDPVHEADRASGKSEDKAAGVPAGTHVVLRTPKTIYDWIVSQITNPLVGDITSLTNGIDIYVTKEGQGLGTTYTATLSPNGRKAVPQEYLDKIDSLYNLDEIFSAGFDEDQINRLVSHLQRSASVIHNEVPNTVNNMAGYSQNNQPINPPITNLNNSANVGVPSVRDDTPPWSVNNSNTVNAPVAPSPYAAAPNTMDTRNRNTLNTPSNSNANTASAPSPDAKPVCYGNYDPGKVNCVVCPFEIPCGSASSK